jgi:hypothetical protein
LIIFFNSTCFFFIKRFTDLIYNLVHSIQVICTVSSNYFFTDSTKLSLSKNMMFLDSRSALFLKLATRSSDIGSTKCNS